MEYYLSKYEELSVLSDTKKCRTSLMRNKDTGELVVKKEMGKESFSVYSLLKSIKNKNLIKVLECFRDEDKTIEIEEYVNGKRLDDYFREKKATLEQVVDVGIALCEGLAPMHKLNLVHRDIQPKNIIITNEGSLKIIDFDISRKENENATHDTTLLGTVGYAAPEQYGFAQTTNRSDIYSIGGVLKELSSFSELDKIIAKCMEMDPANRYENVEQLKNELEKIKDNGFGSGSYNDMEFGTETNRTAKTIKIGNYTIRINNGVTQKIDSLRKNNVVAQKIDNIRKNMENKATPNNSNSGGWKESYMRKTLLGNTGTPTSPPSNSLLAALPSALRNVMKPVTKYTDNVGNNTGNTQGNVISTTIVKTQIFLLTLII